MNASSKSKFVKKAKKKEEWRPTGKVFTKNGYSWRPTGMTFTLVRNACPLTRITATNKVPLREPIPLEVVAEESVVTKVYTRRPKVVQIVCGIWSPDAPSTRLEIALSSPISFTSFSDTIYSLLVNSATQVSKRNRILIEAALTMLIYAKAPLFIWANAVATVCYTQNRSIIRRRHGKTLYKLLYDKKPNLSYLHVFGALCYPNNDSEDLGKLQAKADIGIFIGYAPKKKDYHIYNRRSRKIRETIHIDFDELTAMAFEQLSSRLGLQSMTPTTSSSGLVPNPIPQQPCIPPPRDDLDRLFQPMFEKYFNPPTIVVSLVPIAATTRTVDLADSPVSTSIDQDAPTASIPLTIPF
nr:retrovirus-related Pol polyprotein from transposon TNT 1-94 [Tanacetum cinerariifolium]